MNYDRVCYTPLAAPGTVCNSAQGQAVRALRRDSVPGGTVEKKNRRKINLITQCNELRSSSSQT